jgi:1-deoxy-D-xylulose-5-phosphate reductoisomerase
MKTLSILGSTGSIGTQTIDIVRKHPKEFMVVGLTTNTNIELVKKQLEVLKPEAVAVMDKERADVLQEKVDVAVYHGLEGIKKVATLQHADTVVNALVGSIGVEPTHAAILAGKNIALANKETLVTAGEVIMHAVEKCGVSLMPIDSEHSAIFQCLNGENKKDVKRIVITCSGGPFRNFSKEQMENVTIKDALKHPTWNMGAKITVDSSTWMNKGFEVVEAHWLFGISYEDIDVVVHPQSIVHSLVEFADNSVIAQLGLPDMTIPIQYALTYPKRMPTAVKQLNLAEVGTLEFMKPDFERFPCLKYAYEAGMAGGVMPCVLNAANEVAVQAFIREEIGYLDIPVIIGQLMEDAVQHSHPNLTHILEVDRVTKEKAQKLVAEEYRK